MNKILLALALALTHLSALAATQFYVVVPLKGKASPSANIQVSLDSYTLPVGEVGTAYPGFDFGSALHVTGDPNFATSKVSWTMDPATIPAGMTLSRTGVAGAPVLGGTPAAETTPTGKDFTVVASYKGKSGQQIYSIVVRGAKLQVTQIAIGGNHSCALTTAGGVKCWGLNSYGQLGNNSTTDSLVPAEVTGLPASVASISAGNSYTCAVTAAGSAKCWGSNNYGQLGNNSTTDSLVPVDVTGLTAGIASISSGPWHNCAVTTTGGAKCWGFNIFGQLGNNSKASSPLPVDVAGLTSGVARISAGSIHSCAVTAAGGVKCWGYNGNGQLGNNSTTDSVVPVDVTGLTSGVASISAGNSHMCAVTKAGGAKCWGTNAYGLLGNNSTTASSVPVDVTGLTAGVASMSSGAWYNCAVTTTGGAKCWGNNNYGQLGNNSTTASSVPVDVTGLTASVARISAGSSHACVVTSAGDAKCWGNNDYGKLGNNNTEASLVPVSVKK